PEEFEKLVRNERRIELCFEGQRFYDLRRWATDVSELNDVINRPRITRQSIAYEEVEKRSYPSLYVPIPYTEVVRMKGIVQNAGWSNWE
ncbi:RagB/SusD family nutrient uptake outer membrane protein, partial [Alistipes senegalensis]